METILVIDDDKVLRFMLKESLENNDYLIFEAANGRRCLEILDQHKTDLILLDLNLPDGNGLDFIQKIRERTDVPVIIVSGDHQSEHKINGFDLGADDYVTKPFDLQVLMARIKSHIRRYKNQASNQNEQQNMVKQQGERIAFGDVVFDRAQFQLFDRAGNSQNLTAREYLLLDVLIRAAGRAIRREDLCEAIREDRYVPTPRAIDVKITRIRKKIGDDAQNPQMIKTVRGIGYLFDPECFCEE